LKRKTSIWLLKGEYQLKESKLELWWTAKSLSHKMLYTGSLRLIGVCSMRTRKEIGLETGVLTSSPKCMFDVAVTPTFSQMNPTWSSGAPLLFHISDP
jgi:hypothetical protein